MAPQAQLRSLQSHRVAAPPPWLLGTGAEIVCRQAARRVERQRHQRLGQPPTSNRNSLRYPKSAGEPAGKDRRAGRANQPFGPIHPSCQADCAWIADNDDESPPEMPGLRDKAPAQDGKPRKLIPETAASPSSITFDAQRLPARNNTPGNEKCPAKKILAQRHCMACSEILKIPHGPRCHPMPWPQIGRWEPRFPRI